MLPRTAPGQHGPFSCAWMSASRSGRFSSRPESRRSGQPDRYRGQVVGRTSFAVLALSGALAAPAAAQVIAVNGACFVNAKPSVGAPVTVSGSGFPPGDTVELDSTGVSGTTIVGTAGTFTSTVEGPILSNPSRARRDSRSSPATRPTERPRRAPRSWLRTLRSGRAPRPRSRRRRCASASPVSDPGHSCTATTCTARTS